MLWMAIPPVLDKGMAEPSTQESPAGLAQLIVAVGGKDREAFARLFTHFAPRIKTMMLRAGMTDQGAEDLAQETMLAVWNKAQLFDPAGLGPSAWVYTIARNLRIDASRRARRAQRIGDAATQQPDVEQSLPDALVASSQAEDNVRISIARLSREQLEVVTMSFFENKAHPEIAEVLGIPLGTVKSRLRLAMKRLRTLLEELQ